MVESFTAVAYNPMYRLKKILLVPLWFLFITQAIDAKTFVTDFPDSVRKTKQEKSSFFQNLLKEEKNIWTSPCRIEAREFLFWGSVIAGTAFLIVNDEMLYNEVKKYQEKNEWIDKISRPITYLGDGAVDLGIMGLFYVGGLAFKNEKAKETGLMGTRAIIHTGIVVTVLKHLFGRQRPCVGDRKDHWAGLSGFFKRYQDGKQSYYDSFPSGHTIVAWGSATVIAEQYKETPVIPIICYSLATLTGLSRITECRHWPSDVFMGAVLGYSIGKYLVKSHKKPFHVQPEKTLTTTRITLSYSF